MGASVLSVRALRKTHPDGTEALRGIDLELGGGMYGLLGPNGAGKTTLLSILVLALEPTAGTLLYTSTDRDLDASNLAERSRIRSLLGYLPQDFRPLPSLSGREYLEHCAALRQPGETRSTRRARANELLRSVALDGAADRPAGRYSGGMMRRLGLAQALIHRPRLLIVDEPTAGLDPEERMRFRNLVAEVAEHTSVILSTHIVEDVEATCPRLGVLWNGRLHFDGSPADLLRRASGKLWRLPEAAPLPSGAEALGMRATASGYERLVRSEQAPEHGEPHAPHLEDAYAALLSELGGAAAVHSILESAPEAAGVADSA